jgi:hypothetical protein
MIMVPQKYRGGISLLLIFFFFCGIGSADVSLSPNSSLLTTSAPDNNAFSAVSASGVYTDPIGAFTISDIYAAPNTTYDIDYLFYSRGYGPGTVKYTVLATDYFGTVNDDELTIRMDPAVFTAEPGQVYHSCLHVVTGPAFASAAKLDSPVYRISTYSILIDLNVTLQDSTVHYGDDSLIIRAPVIIPGLPAVESDRLIIPANDTGFNLHIGDSYDIPVAFSRGQGIGNISYTISATPLNVTIVPPAFTAKHYLRFPAQLSVHADRNLTPGNYSFTLDVVGASGIGSYSRIFFVNVTSPEIPKGVTQQSLLMIALAVSALVVAGIVWCGVVKRKKQG